MRTGAATFKDALTNTQTFNALKLTVLSSLGVTALNIVMGTIIAWVLVRDRFPGKALLDLVIDIPFAMPTIVAGLVLLVALRHRRARSASRCDNTRKAVFLALAFVTAAVRRPHRAAGARGDGARRRGRRGLPRAPARLTTFRRIILPTLAPAIFAGAALSFARAISEYGSLVLLSGNLPNRTEVASVRVYSCIEGGNRQSAAAVATDPAAWSRWSRSSCST